jgi:hypothetical protein
VRPRLGRALAPRSRTRFNADLLAFLRGWPGPPGPGCRVAVPAALSTGLGLIAGKVLDQALEGAEVVVNVANSPTFDEASAGFFRTSMNNLLGAAPGETSKALVTTPEFAYCRSGRPTSSGSQASRWR